MLGSNSRAAWTEVAEALFEIGPVVCPLNVSVKLPLAGGVTS